MTQPASPGLAPLDPAVLARRRRQNRLIVALVVLVLIPVVAVVGGYRWGTHLEREWMAHPTFAYNTPSIVRIDQAGDYVVWTYGAMADCAVHRGDRDLTGPADPGNAMESAGFFASASFTADQPGDYDLICRSAANSGYVLVSTASPLGQATGSLLAGILVGVAAFIVGLILLVRALSRNSREKRALQTPAAPLPWPPGVYPGPGAGVAPPPVWPAGPPVNPAGPPTRPTAPPWPPQG